MAFKMIPVHANAMFPVTRLCLDHFSPGGVASRKLTATKNGVPHDTA